MPCNICDRTMQNLGLSGRRGFWCPYCGTLKIESGSPDGPTDIESPKITSYLASYGADAPVFAAFAAEFKKRKVQAAINGVDHGTPKETPAASTVQDGVPSDSGCGD